MEKIDLVYILRNSSRWFNNEIRYSLRSVEKNIGRLYDKVFLVGYCPRFLDKTAINYIEAEDPYANKLRNAIHKFRVACESGQLGKRFAIMNDDFYFMKPTDVIELRNKGTLNLAEKTHKTKGGYYYKAIVKTNELLKRRGIKVPVDYEVHYPMVVETDKFLAVLNDLKKLDDGYLFRSVYGNMVDHEKSERTRDVKVYREAAGKIKKIEKMDFLSSDDSIVNDPKFQKLMAERFKRPCFYEKNYRGVYRTTKLFHHNGHTYNPGDVVREEVPDIIIEKNNFKKVRSLY